MTVMASFSLQIARIQRALLNATTPQRFTLASQKASVVRMDRRPSVPRRPMPEHGKRSRYAKHRCRCVACRRVASDYNAVYYAKRRSVNQPLDAA